jgi:hypothetical protein
MKEAWRQVARCSSAPFEMRLGGRPWSTTRTHLAGSPADSAMCLRWSMRLGLSPIHLGFSSFSSLGSSSSFPTSLICLRRLGLSVLPQRVSTRTLFFGDDTLETLELVSFVPRGHVESTGCGLTIAVQMSFTMITSLTVMHEVLHWMPRSPLGYVLCPLGTTIFNPRWAWNIQHSARSYPRCTCANAEYALCAAAARSAPVRRAGDIDFFTALLEDTYALM